MLELTSGPHGLRTGMAGHNPGCYRDTFIPRAGDMGSANSVGIWRGRWVLTLTLLLLAFLGVAAASVFLPRTYQGSASVVLLASRAESGITGGNPYLNFNSSLTLTADAVSRQVTDPQTASSLAQHGYTASYTVAMPTYSTSIVGSVLLISVTGVGPAAVEHTLNGVIGAIRTTLIGLQSGVHRDDRIQLTVLAPAATPTVNLTHTLRSLAIVAGFGLMIALGVPWVVDAQVNRQLASDRAQINEDTWGRPDNVVTGDATSWTSGAQPYDPSRG